MDRSMKVMFGMMTVAICLLAITMMGNQSQKAYAGEYVGGGDRGTEPTIVSFRVVGGGNHHWGYRMWSDGAVEVNFFGDARATINGDGVFSVCYDQGIGTSCSYSGTPVNGWILIQDSVAGYACVGDTDGDRSVDITDMLAVFDNWGQCEQDPPINIPPDPDLM
jgi:hypothetical protein